MANFIHDFHNGGSRARAGASCIETRSVGTGLNNVCACAICHDASDCARPKYHNNPYENGGVFKNSRVDPGFL